LTAAKPPPAQYWTAQEQWIWDRTLGGEVADFNARYEAQLDPKQDDVRWSDDEKPRLVSEKFLLDVLGRKTYAEAIPPRGLRIIGARFASDLGLQSLHVERQVWLTHSRFDGAVNLVSTRFETSLSFYGSVFSGEVKFGGAKVDGQLNASGATFEAGLNMNGLTVGQALFLGDGTRFVGEVDLGTAKIDGQLDASGATFEAGLNMESLTADQYWLLRDATFAGKVSLVFANVGAIHLGGATFRAPVDASGLTTEGELKLDPPPTWADRARFVLRNAHVGALNDGGDPKTGGGKKNPWPERELELDGFSYGRLVLPRTVRWYIDDWLARDKSHTPQPYEQLAGVLRAHGDPSGANNVLFAARERERSEAWKAKAWPRWIGLSVLNWTIGYGLGWRYFLVLIWIGLITLSGAVTLWTSGADKVSPFAGIARSVGPAAPDAKLDEARPAAQEHVLSDPKAAAPQAEPEDRQGFLWCLWASFDWMLPFIELDKAFTEAIARLQGGPFYLLYFQALAGYVLAGFLAAGLAGLTQSRG
jgi:hypothetical protein